MTKIRFYGNNEGPMLEEPKVVTTQISPAVDEQLELMASEMGISKAQLIREAISVLIGMYRNAKTRSAGKISIL